jgi:hypothetical protein
LGPDRITLAGLALALLAIGVIVLTISQTPFPMFSSAPGPDRLVNASANVGLNDSRFLWNNLPLDLLAQAFLIFAAAAGCLALLRGDEEKEEGKKA